MTSQEKNEYITIAMRPLLLQSTKCFNSESIIRVHCSVTLRTPLILVFSSKPIIYHRHKDTLGVGVIISLKRIF